MIINLIVFLSIAVMLLAVGFARQEERTVTVPLQSSVRYKGQSYHPHSEGVEMPVSHARALGFSEDDYMGEESEEEEDTGESESDGDSKDDDSSGESEPEESSDGSEAKPEEEAESKEDAEESEVEAIPKDTPEYDELIKDERFATAQALLENQDELTDINGIAEKTKQKIVEHVKSKQEG